MKRKIDLNRPPLRMLSWRTMLGALMLCFMTSLSFGQSTYSATAQEIKDLQFYIGQLEAKVADPALANDPARLAEVQTNLVLNKKRLTEWLYQFQNENPHEYMTLMNSVRTIQTHAPTTGTAQDNNPANGTVVGSGKLTQQQVIDQAEFNRTQQ